MILITRQTQANCAAERFQKQYAGFDLYNAEYDPSLYTYGIKPDQKLTEVIEKLKQLPPNPSPDLVDEIIGNNSWTMVPSCDECGNPFPICVVMLGQEPERESNTAWVCGECLLKAVGLLA